MARPRHHFHEWCRVVARTHFILHSGYAACVAGQVWLASEWNMWHIMPVGGARRCCMLVSVLSLQGRAAFSCKPAALRKHTWCRLTSDFLWYFVALSSSVVLSCAYSQGGSARVIERATSSYQPILTYTQHSDAFWCKSSAVRSCRLQ